MNLEKVEVMSNEFKEELNKMETGSVALVFSDPSSDLTVEVKLYLIYLSSRIFDILLDLIIIPLSNIFIVQ